MKKEMKYCNLNILSFFLLEKLTAVIEAEWWSMVWM